MTAWEARNEDFLPYLRKHEDVLYLHWLTKKGFKIVSIHFDHFPLKRTMFCIKKGE